MCHYVSQLTDFAALPVGMLMVRTRDSMSAKLWVLDYLAPDEAAVFPSLVGWCRASRVLAGLDEDHAGQTDARHLPNRKQGYHRHKHGCRSDSFSS